MNFRNQFLEYTSSDEWQKFIIEVATVGANRYEATVFTDNSLDIEDLLEKANEEAIVGIHERNKVFGESKLAFEKALQFPFDHFLLSESKRYAKAKRQLTNQQAGSLRAWRRIQRFLYSARGPWALASSEHHDELKPGVGNLGSQIPDFVLMNPESQSQIFEKKNKSLSQIPDFQH